MAKRNSLDHFCASTSGVYFTNFLFALRVVLGTLFFYAGWTKLIDPDGWSAAGFLQGATAPFADFFQSLAGSVLVDQLNIWGLLLIGLALMLGFFVRPAAILGSLMMLMYYLAHFETNIAHGLIDEHIVYIFILLLFLSGGVGHVLGLDGLMMGRFSGKKKWWQSMLFG